MNKINLNENELRNLKEMIETAKYIKMVEGIYLTPILENNNYKIGIRFIINNSSNYSLITYKEQLKDYKKELRILKMLISEYQNKINNEKNIYEFKIIDSNDYDVNLEETKGILLSKELINSYILYDRYNYINELFEMFIDKVNNNDNSFEIENINALNKKIINK